MSAVNIVACRIPVGANGTAEPTSAISRLADQRHPGWFGVEPETARCMDCGLAWSPSIPCGLDLKSVSCSNCYSDNVMLVAIRVEMPPFDARGNAV